MAFTNESQGFSVETQELPAKASSALLLDNFMSLLLDEGSYSDITIVCKNQKFKVHRCVICPRSRFFEAACKNGFKEASEGEIHLDEDDPTDFEKLIHYLYKMDYDDEAEKAPDSPATGSSFSQEPPATKPPFGQYQQVPATGPLPFDRYQQQLATNHLFGQQQRPPATNPLFGRQQQPPATNPLFGRQQQLQATSFLFGSQVPNPDDRDGSRPSSGSANPGSVSSISIEDDEDGPSLVNVRMYAIGDKYGVVGLKTLARKKLQARLDSKWVEGAFSLTVHEVYTSTPEVNNRGLRDVAVRVALKHITTLKARLDFRKLLDEIPEFTLDLLLKGFAFPTNICKEGGLSGESNASAHTPSRGGFTHVN